MELSDGMLKWSREIIEAFCSPMFFIYDKKMMNLYDRLSRMCDAELLQACKNSSISRMCNIVKREKSGKDLGNTETLLRPFINENGIISISGLLPILSSFPTFNDAMNFIMRVKPGFRFTPQFKEFVELHTVKTVTGNLTTYTLDNYSYEVEMNDGSWSVNYLKNGRLHRINGPAVITLASDNLSLYWYRNNRPYTDRDQPYSIKYLSDFTVDIVLADRIIEVEIDKEIHDLNGRGYDRISYYKNDKLVKYNIYDIAKLNVFTSYNSNGRVMYETDIPHQIRRIHYTGGVVTTML